MKIVIDARLYGLENTGIGRYLVNLVTQLTKIRPDGEFTLLLKNKYFDELKLPSKWKKIKADFRQYSFEEQIGLPHIIYSQKPDIVHFPHFNIPIFWNGPFVVTMHDMSMHRQGINATKLPLPIYILKRIPYKFIFRSAVKRSIKIITPTKAVKDEIVDYFNIEPDKVSYIYEGLETQRFANKSPDVLQKYGLNKIYFFYVGDVYPHKNIKSALDAIRLLVNEGLDVSFVIACSRGYFINVLKNYVKEINIEKYVHFLGFVPDEDLSALLYYSKGLVYPSFSEGFGLQGLEAIASGTLVLASNIAVFKEIYQDFAFYFNPKDISSIASAMKFSLNLDKEKRQKLIKASQKMIKKYSWEKMAKATLNIYENAFENLK